jgi:CubicO group peptidase (beta-lactamase class C family)
VAAQTRSTDDPTPRGTACCNRGNQLDLTDGRTAHGRPPAPAYRLAEIVTTPRTDDVETLIESGTAGPDIRFGLGYKLASPSMPGLGPRSFGHTGAGGRLGIADPDLEIGFGYLCSRMRNIGPAGDPR